MVDATGALIYVGKAKDLRTRLLSYFRSRRRDARARRILSMASGIVWEFCPSEFAALVRELELIRRWRPRLNIQGQPHRRRRYYVCVGRPPAAYVFLARRPPLGAKASFGPVLASNRAREAVRHLNDWFKLRDCPKPQKMNFADHAELFPIVRAAGCIRYEIGTCLGPCAAACTANGYAVQVKAACAFLNGNDIGIIQQLESAMTLAATSLAYERAALLRDKLKALGWLHHQLQRLRDARANYSFIYPISGHEGENRWYLIHKGLIVGALAEPRLPAQRAAARTVIESVYGSPRSRQRLLTSEIDSLLLVASWFQRHPQERIRTLQPAEALTAWL